MVSGNTPDRIIGFALIGKNSTLDGYIFQDESHARTWLAQEYIKGSGYGVKLISYKKRQCCGEPYARKTIRQMKRVDFLKSKRWTDRKGKIINLPE